ncbi:MAG: MFS transporter [Lutispora sp.]|nr:MFS transporter [Lutispora sp.]
MGNRKGIKNSSLILLSIFLGHFFIDFYSNIVPPVLYLFSEKLSLTLAQQGMVSAFIVASASIFQPIIGYYADKRTRAWLLLASLLWIGLFMSLTGVINNYYLLLVAVALGGLASSVFHPLGSALTIRFSSSSKGTSLSTFLIIGGLAMPAASAIVLPLTIKFGLNALVYLLIPGVLVVIFMYFAGLHKITVEQEVVKEEGQKSKLGIYKIKWLSLLVLIPTIRNIVFRAMITFGIQYLTLKSVGLNLAGLAVTLLLFADSLGTFFGGMLADRCGYKNIVIISGISGAIAAAFTFWMKGSIILIPLLIMGFAFALSSAPIVFITQSLIPRNINLATGLVFGLPMGLGGLGAVIFGKIADAIGLVATAKYLIIPVIIMTCIIFMIPKEWETEELLCMPNK